MMAAAAPALIRVISSTFKNWSLEATPRQPLEYDPNDERTSFFISKDSVEETKLLDISKGDFEKQDYNNLDLLLALHVQASGYVFLESLHPTQNIYFTRELVDSRPPKRLLPRSKAPQERILVLLDCDSNIFIDDEIIEFKIGSSNSVPSPGSSTGALEMDGDIAMGHDEEDEDPHVLVQQSHPQELLRRGSTDLAYLTPAVPETIMEEPGVQETPSVKSRFMNPDSATVTLPRALPREDTFEFDELTPRRNRSTAKTLFPSSGLEFGDRSGEMGILMMDDGNLSMSDEEDEIVVQSSRFFNSVQAEPDSVESTADEEAPEILTGGLADMMHSTISTVILPQTPASGRENLGSGAEDMRRQFSEAPMIRSFTAGTSKEVSPAAGEENDGIRRESKDSDTSTKPMKQGIPEGFLYEEHRKDATPKQTYGKNKRAPRTKPRGKNLDMDKRIERAISEDGLKLRGRDRPKEDKNQKKIRGAQEDDKSDEKKQGIPSRRRRNTRANETEDLIMGTGDDDVEEEITLSSKIQEKRGRMNVQSQPDSTAETVTAVGPELKSGRSSRRKVQTPEQEEQGNEKPDVGEKESELTSTTKSGRPRRGTRKQSNTSVTIPRSAQATTTPTRSTRKRRRTPEDADDGQESLVGEDNSYLLSAGEEGSVICVAEPQAKRAKTTPPKKPATKTPMSKRRRRKNLTPTPPPDDSEQFLGDTQYTFPDVTQTHAMDRVEVKTSTKTPKKAPKTAKNKATPKTSTTPSARNKKESAEGPEVEGAREVDEQKTRTSDRYDGDSPKIVFSNSGLGERKDIEKFLRANGGKKMQTVSASGVNFLVVGPGELKRTPKLTVGVALGRWVVEDQWLIDSKEIGYFLDPSPYIPHDPTHEMAWSFSLRTAITRGRNGENNILKDHIVYITPALLAQLKTSKQEESLIEMLKTTGAGSIIKKTPKGRKEDDENGGKSLVLGTEKGDSDVAGLEKLGWSVYGTGIIAVSVLRGQLRVGEEFKIVAEKEGSQAVGRGRKGK